MQSRPRTVLIWTCLECPRGLLTVLKESRTVCLYKISGIHVFRNEISNNVVCAASKGSDQPAHMRCLIRATASRLNILWLSKHQLKFLSLKGGCPCWSQSTLVKMPQFRKSHLAAVFSRTLRVHHFSCFMMGAQWLSGRVLDSRPRDHGFEPHRRHCINIYVYGTRCRHTWLL